MEVLVIKEALAIREVRVTKEASNRNHQAEVDNKSSHQQTVEVLIQDFLMEQQRQVDQVDKIFRGENMFTPSQETDTILSEYSIWENDEMTLAKFHKEFIKT